jgi:uncharacterized protein (DUF488 family)
MNPFFTVGHSTRTIDEFVAMLRDNGVELVADVRTIPRSRKNPQYNRDLLRATLKAFDLDYIHIPELGGLRRLVRWSCTFSRKGAPSWHT